MAAPVIAPTSGVARWLRGGAVGVVASLLSWGGHALSAGVAPAPGVLAVSVVLAVLVAVGLSGRRWQTSSLLVVLLGAQVAFHVAYADAGHSAAFGAAPMGAMPGHGGASMTLAHLAAALVTALLLRRGEDWCWALAHLLAAPWRPLRLVAAYGAPAPRTPVARTARARHLLLLDSSQCRRGPPVPVT